ncbi:MAG: ADP-ribosylglycohydrolase family protein, partial [Selenomonadales bacterium]|nr:ADP-ribosylglycohydrolase family protein [Selenomonadales bacterium]
GDKTKDFPLFSPLSEFTDDTVMILAVAEAFLDTLCTDKSITDAIMKEKLVRCMQSYGRRYPNAGYGCRFARWLNAKTPQPYNSFGNGSAMRISAVAWLFDTLEEVRHAARLSAVVTHDHPEGIKGAEATASAIFLARTGHSKGSIRQYIADTFGYDLSRTCNDIRPTYYHTESCMETVPEAITAFLEGDSFEDVIRTAVSLGGDCDTLTAIAGSIAEAFYDVPPALQEECHRRLPDDLLRVLIRFNEYRKPARTNDHPCSN